LDLWLVTFSSSPKSLFFFILFLWLTVSASLAPSETFSLLSSFDVCLCFDFFYPFSKGLSQPKSKFMQEVKSAVKRSQAIFHAKLVKLRKHNNSCRKETCLGFEVKTNKMPDKRSEKRQKENDELSFG
jgi:hypothetical protein